MELENACLSQNESLGPSFNTLAADDKYSRRNMQNFQQQLQRHYLKRKEFFCNFYCFYQTYINLERFDKKCESHGFTISKSIDSERGGYLNVQSALLQNTFRNQRVQEFQTLSKSARHHYYPIVPWIWDKLSWKKCRLVRFEILELFVNTLTTDDRYSSRNIQNLTQQLQTTMSQNKRLSIEFLLRMSNLEQVQTILSKKMSLLA